MSLVEGKRGEYVLFCRKSLPIFFRDEHLADPDGVLAAVQKALAI